MNGSSVAAGNASAARLNRDTFTMAVTKNVIVVVLCICINYINGSLVHTFNKHQIFKENPRYILFIHLVVNDMLQLALGGLLHIISYAFHTINLSLCCILLLPSIFTTFNTPLNLAGMAAECYVAVCLPLRYAQICTPKRTYILIGLIWAASAVSILPDIVILLLLEPPDFFHSRIFCTRDLVFRSSYSIDKRNTSQIVCLVVVWLILFYTYFSVLFAAKAANVDIRKARNTLLLHAFQLLLSMMNYVRPFFERGLLFLFPQQRLATIFTSYIFIQILPRFLSPILYGVRDHTFRKYLRKQMMCSVTSTHTDGHKPRVSLLMSQG